jgi:DNA-binding beta-propeller fold protein YncE
MSSKTLKREFVVMSILKRLTLVLVFALLVTFFGSPLFAAESWRNVLRLQADVRGGAERLNPFSLAVDPVRHRYYVVDAKAGKIISFDDTGKELARFAAAGQLQHPVALVRDTKGKLWVSDRGANQIFHIDLQTRKIDRFLVKHRELKLVVPGHLALDQDDNLYMTDVASGRILKYDTDFTLLAEFMPPSGGRGFFDLKIKGDKLFALDAIARTVSAFNLKGEILRTVKLPEHLILPVALEVDAVENIYILDRHGREVVVCDKQGRQRYSFFSAGLQPGHLSHGSALLFDWRGNLCVADERNGRVEIVGR